VDAPTSRATGIRIGACSAVALDFEIDHLTVEFEARVPRAGEPIRGPRSCAANPSFYRTMGSGDAFVMARPMKREPRQAADASQPPGHLIELEISRADALRTVLGQPADGFRPQSVLAWPLLRGATKRQYDRASALDWQQ
jgi:hypothetical protein